MKKLLTVITLVLCFAARSSTQITLYNQTFNDPAAPELPGGWFATSDQILTNASSPSNGYAGASGGNNLLSRNCNPNGESRAFQVDGISTLNYTGLTVSFGHRRTNSFTPAVTLEWSSDGSVWNNIAYNSGSAGTTWSSFTSAPLPAGADNQASLSFRWTYTTSVGNVPCDNFAGNFRIDDFKVIAVSVLPVELTDFRCRLEKATVLLSWRTATESDNNYFAVERSNDGRQFVEIGRLAGAGTSSEPLDYYFTDESPAPGTNYYRLRQVDTDGRFSFSPVVSARVGAGKYIQLFPQPATEFLYVRRDQPSAGNIAWEIFDQAGRSVASGLFPAESTETEIPVTGLYSGIYALRLLDGQETRTITFQKI